MAVGLHTRSIAEASWAVYGHPRLARQPCPRSTGNLLPICPLAEFLNAVETSRHRQIQHRQIHPTGRAHREAEKHIAHGNGLICRCCFIVVPAVGGLDSARQKLTRGRATDRIKPVSRTIFFVSIITCGVAHVACHFQCPETCSRLYQVIYDDWILPGRFNLPVRFNLPARSRSSERSKTQRRRFD